MKTFTQDEWNAFDADFNAFREMTSCGITNKFLVECNAYLDADNKSVYICSVCENDPNESDAQYPVELISGGGVFTNQTHHAFESARDCLVYGAALVAELSTKLMENDPDYYSP